MEVFKKQFLTKSALRSKWLRMQAGAKMRGRYIDYKFSTWVYDLETLTITGTSNYWMRSSLQEMFEKNFNVSEKKMEYKVYFTNEKRWHRVNQNQYFSLKRSKGSIEKIEYKNGKKIRRILTITVK